ncbi:MAG: hypothetical protein IJY74_00350, partial [Oscillospiraceae bacterium]|nr:hypothetical protein [Oscillospiraceae bacterium]
MKKNKLLSIITAVSMLCGMTSAPVFADETEVKDSAAIAASVRAYLEENGYTGEALENAMAIYETGAPFILSEYNGVDYYGFYDIEDQGSDLLMYEALVTYGGGITEYTQFRNCNYIKIAINLDNSIGDYSIGRTLGDDVVVTETPVEYMLSDDWKANDFVLHNGVEIVFDNIRTDFERTEAVHLLRYPISEYNYCISPRDSIREGNLHLSTLEYDTPQIGCKSYCYAMGDMNHDGMVNAVDYAIGLRYAAGEYTSTGFDAVELLGTLAADMDMNGEITLSDLEAILDLSYYTEALTANYAYAERLAEEDERVVAKYFADNGYTDVEVIEDAMYIYSEGKAAAATGGTTDAPAAGDVNCDGAVNAIDYTEMLRYLSGQEADVYEVSILDVNSDGVCDIADATVIPTLSAYSSVDDA